MRISHGLALSLVAITALSTPASAAPDRAEITDWESVRDSTTPAELEAYLEAYPSGQFAPLAKLRLKTLQGEEKVPNAAAPPATVSTQELGKLPNLVERLAPSVVSVNVESARTEAAPDDKAKTGTQAAAKEAKKFFGDFDARRNTLAAAKEAKKSPIKDAKMPAMGSGMVLSPDGFIVTASSVVDKADAITVVLADGTRLPAKTAGFDQRTGIALLKVEAKTPLTPVIFGDSDRVRRGQQVVAMGNPFGLAGTVSLGIISATGRNINAGPYDYLQTDAAINRGHSGGPLFDLDGNVVGMAGAIYSPDSGNVGVGFAMPSNLVRDVAQQLKQSGRVDRGWLGVKIENIPEDEAKSLGMERADGAKIVEIMKEGPADGSGLEVGDVAVAVDGRAVANSRAFARILAGYPSGAEVELKVNRKGNAELINVKLGKLPNADGASRHLGDVKDLDTLE